MLVSLPSSTTTLKCAFSSRILRCDPRSGEDDHSRPVRQSRRTNSGLEIPDHHVSTYLSSRIYWLVKRIRATDHSVWRPFRVPVLDWPLAICDATTVNQADLVPTDIIYPTFVTENFMVHFNEESQWYWLPEQKANEMLVFKAVDSHDASSCRESSLCSSIACPFVVLIASSLSPWRISSS